MRKFWTLFLILIIVATIAAAAQATPGSDLQKQAKITKEEAQKTALARVPNGTVKESELEKEHGKLVWSFDIATPDSPDVTEVQVDAKTGKVVSVEKETAKKEAAEKKAEAKKKDSGKK